MELSACTDAVPAGPAEPTPVKIAHVVLNTADIDSLCGGGATCWASG